MYEGSWKDDFWHGFGRWGTITGTYEGDFVKGRREGQGKMDFKKKSQPLSPQSHEETSYYEGSWKEDKPHGIGTYVCPSAYETKYEGEWEFGKRSGKGILFYSNGAKFEGSFERNKPSGNGKLVYPDGLTVTGKWRAGAREPKCTISNEGNSENPVQEGIPAGQESGNSMMAPPSPGSTASSTTSQQSNSSTTILSADEERGMEETGLAEYLPPPVFPFVTTANFLENHW